MDLITFLKTYSKINNKFIDDFYGLYKPGDKYNFCIDLQVVANWLETKKGNVKKTLIASYIENKDYIIEYKNRNNQHGGHNQEIILITPKCFKKIAMSSKTKRADQVRELYYELEELVDRYKRYVIDGLADKVTKLQNNQKPKINPEKGVIYVMNASDDTKFVDFIRGYDEKRNKYFKVGKAKKLADRMYAYNHDKIDDVIPEFIYETDDIEIVEKCIKAVGKKLQYRAHKEIYKIDLASLKDIITTCGSLNNKVNIIYENDNPVKHIGGSYYVCTSK